MKIEILTIGDELLFGDINNSNSVFLAQELKKSGYKVDRQTSLSDDPIKLKEGLKEILTRSDLVIATGGLGPTKDDNTKKIAADLFARELVYDRALAEDLFKRFEKNQYIESQAFIPDGSLILKNERGTASGLILEKEKKTLILLPGVPVEMEHLFISALAFIQKKFPLKDKVFREFVNICLKKEIEIEPFLDEIRKKENIEVGIYPEFFTTKVALTSENREALLRAKKSLNEKFAKYLYSSKSGKLAEAIKDLFISKKKTLALAESCTGGAIASAITFIPGSSAYFLGSFVSYANEFKKDILHVSEKTLKEHGAVSPQTVEEMVEGVLRLTKADFALAVSGIAGPGGGSIEKPAGTVVFGFKERGETLDKGIIHLFGDRELVIKYSVSFALSLIWVRISSNLTFFDK